MKKLILIGGILAALGSVAAASCLVMANRITATAHQEFFDLVADNDGERFLDQCTDSLQSQVDRPVLEAWMNQVNQTLGQYQRTSVDDFQCNIHQVNDSRVTELAGTANLDHGSATVELTYVDGLIAGFSVDSNQVSTGWFRGPTDATLYRQRTTEFLTAMTTDESLSAFTMMHESLQQQVSVDSLRLMGQRVIQMSGTIESITCLNESFNNKDGERLTIEAQIVGDTETLDAMVVFQFVGLKGHLIEFSVAPPPAK